MKNNIKVIIFDLGGVIVSPKVEEIPKLMSEYMGIEYQRFNEFMKKCGSNLTKGKISLTDLYSKAIEQFELSNLTAEDITNEHLKIFQEIIKNLDKEVLLLVNKLKKNYRVVCLANAERDIVPLARKRGMYDYFERAYISTELGMEKPDPEIYLTVLKDLNHKPSEAIFIDDKAINVNAANQLGINSILYKNFKQLQKELKNFGLSF